MGLPKFIDDEFVRARDPSSAGGGDIVPPGGGGGGGDGGGGIGGPGGHPDGVPYIQNLGKILRSFQSFAAQLSVLTNRIRGSDPFVQNKTAYVVAQIYRNRLRAGVGEPLSPLSRALTGEHRPLSTLADHVIVKPARRGHPATVTFEKGWSRKAWMLENGYAVNAWAYPLLRAQILHIAMIRAGATDLGQIIQQSNGGHWFTPPRPHIHLLNDSISDKLMAMYARHVAFGEPLEPAARFIFENTQGVKRGKFQLLRMDNVPI